MNKKGSLFLGVVFAIFFFMIAIMMLPFIKDGVTQARTDLSCASSGSDISDGNKFTCIFVGSTIPYFIIAILVFVGGMIGREL